MKSTRMAIRAGLIRIIIASLAVVGLEATGSSPKSEVRAQQDQPFGAREQIVAERDGVTVLTGQATPATNASITAYASDGRLLYFNETYGNYFDVDPVPGTTATVDYVASDLISADECRASTGCIRNHFVRVNLTTGEQRQFYSNTVPRMTTLSGVRVTNGKIHDFDRINETHVAVADLGTDQVYILNVRTGVKVWTWDAQQSYSLADGGEFPADWTHVNDVEVLEDGRLMVSVRNFDRVIFLHQNGSVDRDWTLGQEDNYSILFEQHNPDYIDTSEGGPAVIVADSENSRIIEYQRTNGTWTKSWAWADQQLQWPRDADRLPNGHTLITDTHGGRILEIDNRGTIVWQVASGKAYEAERLSSPGESGGGPAATKAGLQSKGDTLAHEGTSGGTTLDRIRNIVAFILPDFFTLYSVIATSVFVGAIASLGIIELYWRGIRVEIRSPIRIQR